MERPLFKDLPIYFVPDETIHPYHGRLDAKVWVVVNTTELSSSGNISFLQKILNAVSLDWDADVCVISLRDKEILSSEWLRHKDKVLLSFGLPAKNIGLQINTENHKVFSLDSNQFLFTFSLDEIQNHQAHKKALWSALQSLFNL